METYHLKLTNKSQWLSLKNKLLPYSDRQDDPNSYPCDIRWYHKDDERQKLTYWFYYSNL